MYLQLSYIIKPLHLGKTDKLSFEINYNTKKVIVDFAKIPPEKMIKGYEKGDLIATATTEIALTKKRETQFSEIKHPLSNSIKEFINPINLDLYDCILKAIKGVRWRLRNESSSNPIRFWGGFKYSSDGGTWQSFPDQVKLVVNFGLPFTTEYKSDELLSVQHLVSQGEYEPIGHELLHEAWELRKDNPRSSLVIGLAAAETAFKHFSSNLIPAASWLIQNLPSPSLVKMLENFLPQIPAKNKIYGKVLAPPKEILDVLEKGVVIRNQIVHGNKADVKKETVEEVLNTVRDVLYLLDFYNGHTWAWSYINPIILNSMIGEAKK